MAARGELRPAADPALLAKQTLAVLQGGLVLTQVRRDPKQMRAAAAGAPDLRGLKVVNRELLHVGWVGEAAIA
jgi:hypothetical protein